MAKILTPAEYYKIAQEAVLEVLESYTIVIRCKDCKYYKQLDDTCPYLGEDGYYREFPGEDEFCSRGRAKE